MILDGVDCRFSITDGYVLEDEEPRRDYLLVLYLALSSFLTSSTPEIPTSLIAEPATILTHESPRKPAYRENGGPARIWMSLQTECDVDLCVLRRGTDPNGVKMEVAL